jgi:hypothetical protein
MTSEGSRQRCVLEAIFGFFRRTGDGTLTRQETELGRPSLAIAVGDQQDGLINLRVKEAVARRESESGVVLKKVKTTQLN